MQLDLAGAPRSLEPDFNSGQKEKELHCMVHRVCKRNEARRQTLTRQIGIFRRCDEYVWKMSFPKAEKLSLQSSRGSLQKIIYKTQRDPIQNQNLASLKHNEAQQKTNFNLKKSYKRIPKWVFQSNDDYDDDNNNNDNHKT